MNRRVFLASLGGAAASLSAAPPRSQMGVATTCYLTSKAFPKDTIAFLEYCNALGAGGSQAALSSTEPAFARKLRARTEQLGMYLEVMAALPKTGQAAFERTLQAAREAGASCVRCGCLGGRRYETFDSMEAWKRFVADSRASLERAVKVAERERLPIALENHKDWTVDEMTALLKSYSSEYLGVCLDAGNNISLLDDPMDVVGKLAPYTLSTHLKDMALARYEDGFLLSEVPLGEGILDIPKIVSTIRKARPATRLTLEMITRDPLKVPVLRDKYWETFENRDARLLARTLGRAGREQSTLPYTTGLDTPSVWRYEEDNVKRCLWYSRHHLES